MSNTIHLQWVTNTADELNNYWNNLILFTLSQPKFFIKQKSITPLQNSITLFDYYVIEQNDSQLTLPNNYIIANVDNILGMIEKISYIPFEFSLLENSDIRKKCDMDTIIENSKSLIVAYLKSEFYISVDYIDHTVFTIDFETNEKVHKFVPHANDQKIYETSKNVALINNICNLNTLFGYRYLSSNPLIKYVIDKYNDNPNIISTINDRLNGNNNDFHITDIRLHHHIYLYKVVIPNNLVHIEEMMSMLETYINDGYFTIPNSLSDNEYTTFEKLYPEIALAFHIELIDSWKLDDLSQRIFCFHIQEQFTDDIPHFLDASAALLVQNKLPILNFSNKWCSIFASRNNNTRRRKGKVDVNWMKFFYLIIKSYLKLMEEHHILFNYLDTVILQPDYTISASFGNINQYKQFQSILDSQFVDEGDLIINLSLTEDTDNSSFYDTIDKLEIETTISLTNALAIRWYWSNINLKGNNTNINNSLVNVEGNNTNNTNINNSEGNNTNTLLIKSDDKYYIIVDSNNSSNKLLTNYDTEYIEQVKQELITELRNEKQEKISDEEAEEQLEDEGLLSDTDSELSFIEEEDEEDNINNEINITIPQLYRRLERNNVNLKQQRRQFVKNLRHHYLKCRNDEDIITREQISKMSITDLLEIIIVEIDNEHHCFSRDYLMKTGLYVDPATGYTLNDRTVKIMKQQDFGVRGYFDYGILKGISYVPELSDLNIEKAKVDINIYDNFLTVDLLVNSKDLVSCDYYEMNMVEEFTLSLATMDLNIKNRRGRINSKNSYTDIMGRIQNTKEITDEQMYEFSDIFTDMWNRGYLLSDWGRNLLLGYGKISYRSFKEHSAAIAARENDVYGMRFFNKIIEMSFNQ